MKILHISDIHIGKTAYDTIEELAIKISEEIGSRKQEIVKLDTMVVTGDIFDASELINISNRKNAVEKAIKFFDTLLSNLAMDKIIIKKEDIIFTPGNHDIIRNDPYPDFNVYIDFLKNFYGNDVYADKYRLYEENNNLNALISITKFEQEKVAIISLNSAYVVKNKIKNAKIENAINKFTEKDFDDIFHSVIRDELDNIKEKLKENLLQKMGEDYIDYGYISSEQLSILRRMINEIEDVGSYELIAVFHHHLQLFPEVQEKCKNDISVMKNSSEVISRLLKYNIKVVLHGHKHMGLITPIANEEFINDPKNLIYAISAGSIGKKDITNRMFQIIEIFNKSKYDKKLKITKYEYNQDKCEKKNTIEIPPKRSQGSISIGILKESLDSFDTDIYIDYENNLRELDQTSRKSNLENVIKFVENTIFSFEEMQKRLNNNWRIGLLVLVVLHYRLNSYHNKQSTINDVKKYLSCNLERLEISQAYYEDICNFTEASFIENHKEYKNLIKENNARYSEYSSFILATTLIVDIYMYLSEYSYKYFNHIEHKLNISVDINDFYKYVPSDKIVIASTPDRREININLKCKNPSFHKVAIIIIKNIEENINKYEKLFANIGLKLYHIRTDVERENYNQEDYNFEAYLPTLMELLIGDNIYKQKEVFIRELIQNSYDAIMLRKNIDTDKNFDDQIIIDMKVESEIERQASGHKTPSQYIKIKDNGVGMNIHNIERYFTGIGRSYYTSNDFKEIQKKNNTRYRAISNFGIGFLSCFMVAQEVNVLTKYYERNSEVINVDVPNFDGCFFINKDNCEAEVGTSIILYEKNNNDNKDMNFEYIQKYMHRNFMDFPLSICIRTENGEEIIPALNYRKQMMNRINRQKQMMLHVFIDNDGNLSYDNKDNLIKENYGIFIEFDNELSDEVESYYFRYNNYLLNSGILLDNDTDKQYYIVKTCETSRIILNYPPSLIQLNVSRDTIVEFKKIDDVHTIADKKEEIMDIFYKQMLYKIGNCKTYYISEFENSFGFLNNNKYSLDKIKNLEQLLPKIYITATKTRIKFSLEKLEDKNSLFQIEFSIVGELLERLVEVKMLDIRMDRNYLKYNSIRILNELISGKRRTYNSKYIKGSEFKTLNEKYGDDVEKYLNDVLTQLEEREIENVNLVNISILIIKLLRNILSKYSYVDLEQGISIKVKKKILLIISAIVDEYHTRKDKQYKNTIN